MLVTGDLTDDGVGYELILAALAPFVERRRLLAVPGNHDVYDSPPFVVPGHARRRRADKIEAWRAFAAAPSCPIARLAARPRRGRRGLRPRLVQPGAHAVLRLGRAHQARRSPSSPPPSSACRPTRLRIAMLHHHVVNPPMRAVGATPWQLGLRLRNARVVYETLRSLDFRLVLNGHRHVGYRYHPSHAPMFVSAPSATLGCRSGSAPRPFYWRIELDGRRGQLRSRTHAVTAST